MKKLIFCLLLLMVSFSAFCDEILIPHYSFLYDKEGVIPLQKIPDNENFFPFPHNSPKTKFNAGYLWIKIEMEDVTAETGDFILVNKRTLPEAYLFKEVNHELILIEEFGEKIPSKSVSIRHNTPAFRISPEAFSREVYYLRIYAPVIIYLDLDMQNPVEFFSDMSSTRSIQFLIIGLYLAIILFNTFSGLLAGERSFMFYALYMGSNLFFFLRQKRLLWLALGNYSYPDQLFGFSILMNILTGSLFCIVLLKMYKEDKLLFRIILGIGIFSLCAHLAGLIISPYTSAQILNISALLLMAFILLACIRAIRRGNRFIITILASYSFLLIGIVYEILTALLQWQTNWLKEYGQPIGALTQALIITMALLFQTRRRQIGLELKIERARREKTSREMENLQKINTMKDRVLARTSHELKTPLMGIIGTLENILSEHSNQHMDTQLDTILYSANRLKNLIDDILDYENIRNSSVRINPRVLFIEKILNNVLATLMPLAEEKGLRIRIDVHENISIKADQDRLIQILLNLVGNSIKFTQHGEIIIHAEIMGEMCCLSVSDTGRGIKEEDMPHVFDEYFHAEDGGTGLGLNISKKLAELMGGTLSLESRLNIGTTTRLIIPLAPSDMVEDLEDVEDTQTEHRAFDLRPYMNWNEEVEKSKSPVIFIIDDDPVNLQVIIQTLSQLDCRIRVSLDGSDAEEFCTREKVSLVIMDLMLPLRSGMEITRSLRTHWNLFELPVIMLTARTGINAMSRGFEAGVNDYLTKPYDRIELISRAKSLLQLKMTVENNSQLTQAGEEKNMFISFMTHNVNSPLTTLMHCTRSLGMIKIQDPTIKKRLESLSMAAEQINQIISNVMTTYRLSDGKIYPHSEVICLNEELELMLIPLRQKAGEKEQSVITDFPDDYLYTRADKLTLREAINNLVENSIKYSPRKTSIFLTLTATEEKLILTIQDQGPGFSKEDREMMYQRFSRLSAQPTGGEKSTGLGLYISRKLILLNKGDITLMDSGKGACFKITFNRESEENSYE